MPVKVRCTGCQKVLNAPDAARGKAVKCPKCQTKIRVPAAAKAGKGAAKRVKQKAGQPKTNPEIEALSKLDLSRFQDAGKLCQKCGADVSPEDMECPQCGVNLETGELSSRDRKKRSRKGPDPSEFYRKAWTDSWKFLKKNKALAFRTGVYWTFFLLTGLSSLTFMAMCVRVPPMVFWAAIATVLLLGIPGWYWFLSMEIINATTERNNRRLKRIEFDAFANMALGLKAVIWPIVLVVPFAVFFPILPVVVFPLALIHMSMPYTYKAWLPWEMGWIAIKNIGPVLYWLLIAFVVFLPLILIVGLPISIYATPITVWLLNAVSACTNWTLELMGSMGQDKLDLIKMINGEQERGFFDYIILSGVAFVFAFLTVLPLAFAMAYPSLFMMRVTGLIGYYFKDDLDLVMQTKSGVPAGFGARYLAYLVDILISNVIIGLLSGAGLGIGLMMTKLGAGYLGTLAYGGASLAATGAVFLYWTKSECGAGQGTLGKRSLGIIVTDLEGKPISMRTATGRFFGRMLSGTLLNIGFLMCIFHERKQTLHDKMTNTQVVWKGDDLTA